ncbi:MAG: hypothetical protein E6J90_49540 [Deltaproteobacteria bacterium]|nr:MAG: hypothetical protein E6J90_49540 [Deltaproteobacteria bacterium]TMQ08325.1 MAG: hypothetical protein E6J91_33470 [Deltaproteobacteria bacterium]
MPAHAPVWYAVAQGALCLSVAWAILALYQRGTPIRQGEPAPTPARDEGALWMGIGVALWSVTGGLLLLPLPDGPAQALRTLLSSANSGCLLISASHLDYGPALLQRASDYRRWNQVALIGSLAIALVTLALDAAFGPAAHAARLPDFLLSSVTLLLWGFGLFRSFHRRGFAPLAVLAVLAISLQFAAQLPEIVDEAALGLAGERRWILNLVSKAMVLVAFLSLAMSWVHEVAERPSHSAIRLRFTGRRAGARYVVDLGDRTLEMRETPHRDLLSLAIARVRDTGHDAGWVSLLDLVGRLDDSRIRRMREDLKPVGLDKEIEANGHKSYRLAIEPQHLSFDREALARLPDLEAVARQIP